MQREIKFRAWDKKSKAMIETPLKVMDLMHYSSEYELELMQFTGLKDKNGKDIYEGDVIGEVGVYHFLEREGWEAEKNYKWANLVEKSENFTGNGEERYIEGHKLSVVRWEDKSCGFEPFSDSENNCYHCGGGKSAENVEYIGNIYENPELLPQPN